MPSRATCRKTRPTIVVGACVLVGGCTSPVVREYELIRSIILPAEPGNGSIITSTDRVETWHAGVGDEIGVRVHRSRTRSRSERAIVLEPIGPGEPHR